MLRAVGLSWVAVLAFVLSSPVVEAGEWVLHHTSIDRFLSGSGSGELPEETEGVQVVSGTLAGYDSENEWWYSHGWWYESNPTLYAGGDGISRSSNGPDDFAVTWCRVDVLHDLTFNAGRIDGGSNATTEMDIEIQYQGGTPTGTFSLTLSVVVGLNSGYVGEPPLGDARNGGAVADAWVGAWQDALLSGEYVSAGYGTDGFVAWTYDPVNGYVEHESPNVSTSYTFTGLSGDGQDVHFRVAADKGISFTDPVGPFQYGELAFARCEAEITPE